MDYQISASDMDEEYVITVQYPYRYFINIPLNLPLYISIIVLLAFPLLIIVRKFNLPTGDRIIMLIISFFYIYLFNMDFFQSINVFIHTSPIHKVTCLLPLLQFRSLFLLELYVIKKARYEIFTMAIICNFIVVVGTSFTLAKLVLIDGSMLSCLLFSTIITCVEGCDSFGRIKQMERNKHLLIILESDALLGYTLILTFFHVVLQTYAGVLLTWQTQILFVVQYLLGGFICGIVLGKIAGWCLSQVYNDSHSALIVCLCFTYLSYSICEYVLIVSGPIVSFIVCLKLSAARKLLTAEAVLFIRHFVDVVTYVSTMTIFVATASRLLFRTLYFSSGGTLLYVFFSYCFMVLLRMISLLMVYPLLRRVGYKMDLASCTFYGWAGASRGPISLVLAQIAYRTHIATESFDTAMPHVVATVVLSIIINYSTYSLLLHKLGFYTMSTMRRGNMQNCVDYLNTRKWALLTILKMASRLMTDTNYPIVYKYTVIKNPYKGRGYKDADEDEEKLINELGLRESKCPLCNRDISLQPTVKEKAENLKEARLRLLKIQKVAFIQQYELGMLSKGAIRFLLHLVEAATESKDPYIKLDEFYKIFSNKGFYYHTKKIAECLHGTDVIKVPKMKRRRIFYRIVTHVVFECFMFVLIILVTIPFLMQYLDKELLYNRFLGLFYTISFTFLIIFLTEILVKIYAFSSDGYCDGVKTYFRSKWNILDFSVVTVHLFAFSFVGITREIDHMFVYRSIVITFNGFFKTLRLIRLLRVLSVSWIAKCNQKINSKILFGYDIGKVIIITYSDLADTLYQITENSENVFIIKSQLDKDRDTVNITLENVIKLKPSVPIQVKTRQAIKSTLNHLRATTIELKNLGYVDNLEFDQIMSRLNERNIAMKALGKIKPNSPKALFMQLPFITADDPVTDFLFSQLEIINWEPNILIVDDLDDALGMFILLQGILRITYIPHQRVLDDLIKYGMLPIVDFISPFRADVPVEEFIFPGNSFGELAFLTQRKYNCRIQTDTKCKALFLSTEKLSEALKISCDPIQGLGARLWKSVIMDFATGILRTIPGYQNNSLDQIRMTIDRSFVPNLQHYKTFIVTDLMEDLLLVEGLAADISNGDVYVAPCYLPRTVQKLILYSDEEYNMDVKVIPKLVIIPMKDVDEYEIMERVEDMVELIDNPPDYLLVHKYRKKKLKNKKKVGGGGLIGLSKRRRFIDSSIMQSRSRTLSLNISMRSDPSIKSESNSYKSKSSGDTETDEASYESSSSAHGSVLPNRVTYLIPEDFDDNVSKITVDAVSSKITKESDVAIKDILGSIVAPILENLMEDIFYGIENKNYKVTLKQAYSWEVDKLGKLSYSYIDGYDSTSSYLSEPKVRVDEGKTRKRIEWVVKEKPTGENNSAENIEGIAEIVTTEPDSEDGKQLDVLISSEDYLKGIVENILDTALVAPEVAMDKEVSETLDLQELGSRYSATGFAEVEDVDSDRDIVKFIERLLSTKITKITEGFDTDVLTRSILTSEPSEGTADEQIIIKDILSDSKFIPGNRNSVENQIMQDNQQSAGTSTKSSTEAQGFGDKTNESLPPEFHTSVKRKLLVLPKLKSHHFNKNKKAADSHILKYRTILKEEMEQTDQVSEQTINKSKQDARRASKASRKMLSKAPEFLEKIDSAEKARISNDGQINVQALIKEDVAPLVRQEETKIDEAPTSAFTIEFNESFEGATEFALVQKREIAEAEAEASVITTPKSIASESKRHSIWKVDKGLRISADEKDTISSDQDAERFPKMKKKYRRSKKLEKLDSEDDSIKKNTEIIKLGKILPEDAEILELPSSQKPADLSKVSPIPLTIHIPSNSKEHAYFEKNATVHQENIEEKSTELFNMNQTSLDGNVNMSPSTSNEPDEQSIDRDTGTKKHGSRNKNDKEKKKREKEANTEDKLEHEAEQTSHSLSFDTDLDLERKILMWQIKAANENHDSQEQLSPSYEGHSKSKRKRKPNEEETSRSEQIDFEAKTNSRKFDRSIEKIVTEYKLKAKRAGSIEEEVKSDNEKQRNTKETSFVNTEESSVKKPAENLPTSNNNNSRKIVENMDVTERKRSRKSIHSNKTDSGQRVSLRHTPRTSNVLQFRPTEAGQSKIGLNSRDKSKAKRKASSSKRNSKSQSPNLSKSNEYTKDVHSLPVPEDQQKKDSSLSKNLVDIELKDGNGGLVADDALPGPSHKNTEPDSNKGAP